VGTNQSRRATSRSQACGSQSGDHTEAQRKGNAREAGDAKPAGAADCAVARRRYDAGSHSAVELRAECAVEPAVKGIDGVHAYTTRRWAGL